ncbi:SMP-30/gluconolactonase/LRE family protein [Puniceibacterium sp. IMCC21224]|uniref:SMP-30/gluconolactonase/LRE family protein n=1 Tax=Puniceibacterium sp. IMCC21224 TaxID=1618204 RepID=UPI00065D1322|nr:SMP-30/gluconolactonase/LRE family protein [Puniceibacterium sp. IMCC21224]KMK65108.1 gluconolactonase [Puniceibacterium sp. IMCC21224]
MEGKAFTVVHESFKYTVHTASVDALGEVPTWRPEEQALYWIDVRRPCLYRRDWATGAQRQWIMPETIGTYVFRDDGNVLVGLQSGIGVFDLNSGTLRMVAAPYADLPDMRFNDGHCDRQGRLWIGTMDNLKRGADGVLFRLDDRGLVQMADQVVVPNSLCFSPDGTVMYFSDGRDPTIWAFTLDPETGDISDRRVFAEMQSGGAPDGATVDCQGCLWSTQYGASRIDVFAPDGSLKRVIPVPAVQPTCVAFGGAEMQTLIVTTGRQNMSDSALAADTLAGAVLSLEVDVAGLEETPFRF